MQKGVREVVVAATRDRYLRRRIAVLNRAHKLAYPTSMSRFLCAICLALRPAQRALIETARGSSSVSAQQAVGRAALSKKNRMFSVVQANEMSRFLCVILMSVVVSAQAATLPPDSVDILHHNYDGGGMKIDGPSVLVRKSIGPQVSVTGHYYVDTVSAASVDVLARASEYEEERTEISGGIDFLHEKTIMSMGYTNSSENDYEADTIYFSVAQDFFGDLTTLSLAYAKGKDDVGTVGSDVTEDLDRNNYKIGLTQVITKNMLMGLDVDVISDEGKLENPYRANRYIDPDDSTNFLYQDEVYPDTRTSTAAAVRAMYYLPYRASVKGEYRYFSDSWGIKAHTYDIGYVHPFLTHWTAEVRYRYYTQDKADFYADLFPFANSQTHVGRDKELSTFSGTTMGFGISYELKQGVIPGIDRLQFNILADWLDFSYDDFRDVTKEGNFLPGEEPLYEFDALVTRTSLILEF